MNKRLLFWILLIVACSIPLLFGIFHSGFFVSDDGHWMIIRLSAFYEALSSGQFPVRFLPRLNEGLGYPVADFLYPLFLYIGSVLHVLKIPYIQDIKIILAASMIFSGVGMYLFLKQSFKNFSAFLGAIVYMYLPYHLYDIYTRGSVGEIVSLALVPFLFLSIGKKSWILLSVLLGLLITAHNTLALFFLPILIVYSVIRGMKISHVLYAVGLGLGLSAFFWIPALYDRQFTIFNSVIVANPAQYFVNIVGYQLIGWIGVLIFGGVLLTRSFIKDKTVVFFFTLGILSLFFSISLSSMFWNIPFLSQFVQFPFRFLSITLIAESFLSAYVISQFKHKILPSIILLIILGFSCYSSLFPRNYDYHDNSFYATNVATTTVQNEYMPKWIRTVPQTYVSERILLDESIGTFHIISQKGTNLLFETTMKKQGIVIVNFAYFPGWQVKVDNASVSSRSSKDGYVEFALEKGNHIVQVTYKETTLHLIADIISIASLTIFIVFLFKKKYGK